MATYDLTRLDLSHLDSALLTHLLTVGEPLHVERKRDLPTAEQLSELLGSMGNTEGGWALLGVDDDGSVIGLAPSRSDLQDEIRNRVQGTLDPLPNFSARRVPARDAEVGVVRVYRSEDTPLVCTHKGAAYIRLPGGKRPINSRRELDQLIERGRSSTEAALHRLHSSTAAATALGAPELNQARSYEETPHREWVLRMVPLSLDANSGDRIRTQAVREAVENEALSLLPPPLNAFAGDEWAELRPVSPGWVTWAQRSVDAAASAIVVDPAGVVTAMARDRGGRAVINIEPLVEQTLEPLIRALLVVFAAAGLPGRFLCDLHARGFAGVVLQARAQGHVEMPPGTRASQPRPVDGNAGADDLRAVAWRLAVDIAADAGLLVFSAATGRTT